MDIEGRENNLHQQQQQQQQHVGITSSGLKRFLVVLNCVLMALGNTGGPLLLRLYFRSGGHRVWLSSFLETAGWPLLLVPLLAVSRTPPSVFATPRLLLPCAALGLLTGLDDFLYAYGLAFLPVSTSSILISTQLAFTALFAFLLVRQRFTPYSLNAVALLTVGAVILGLHVSSDRPPGVSRGQYYMGFFLTLGAAALYGLVLPLVELTYRKAKRPITYTLVIEMQLVMGFFATAFCAVGMIVNKDFQAIPKEAKNYELGEARYYAVLVSHLLREHAARGIIIAVFIPVVEVLGVIFFDERFSSDKGVALALSLWGLASYSYGEYREGKEKKEKEVALRAQSG
uniref:Probable purine permease n=1 Tax=Ananas comosus var. bracteatus TaxID=296719 RepID=A0A6V7P633_ANACO|nr:unnamed protein product [Ananas comosus var. bracteatus]